MVRSHLVMVPVELARRYRARWLRGYFSTTEARHFAGRPAWSLAGAVALKRAAVRLYRELMPGRAFRAQAFGVGHADGGAPVLTKAPPLTSLSRAERRGRLHVSIAHTAEHAYGLVAYASGG